MALINCPECGKQMSDRAEACPNCGYVMKQPTTPTKNVYVHSKVSTNKQKRMGRACLIVVIALFGLSVLAGIIGAIISDDSTTTQNKEAITERESQVSEMQRRKSKLEAVTTTEEARNLLDGTVWHYTKNLSDPDEHIGLWFKVEFHGNTYTHYRAKPSDGAWTKDKEGTYEITEGRYSNSGEKYIAVKWDGGSAYGWPSHFALTFGNFQLAVTSAVPSLDSRSRYSGPQIYYGQMEFGDYEWD